MKCSIETQKYLVEEAKKEFRRMQKLQKDGYEVDEVTGSTNIAETMDNLLKVIRKQPDKIKITQPTDKADMLKVLLKNNGDEGTLSVMYNGGKSKRLTPTKLTELNGKYTLTAKEGTYTFDEGKINSNPVDGKYVTVPAMVLTKAKQADWLQEYSNGAPMKVAIGHSPIQSGTLKVSPKKSVEKYQNALVKWVKDKTGVKTVTNDEVLKISMSAITGISAEVAKYTPATNTIEQVGNITRTVEIDLRNQVYASYMERNGISSEEFSETVMKSAEKELKDSNVDIEQIIKELANKLSDKDSKQELTHEMIHAGVLGFMIDPKNADSKQMKRMEELYQLALDNKKIIDAGMVADGKVNQYWATNIHEFVAEGLSNPQLINTLMQIPVKNKGKLASAFKEFVDTLVDMLGLQDKVKDSMYEYLLDGFASIVEESSAGENNSAISKELVGQEMYKIQDAYGFGDTYHKANKAANKYVADISAAAYTDADKWLAPKVKKWHDKAIKDSKIYARVYNTIKDGANDIELINKVAHTLFLTGDTIRIKIAELTKMVEDSNRAAMEVLSEEMPEWDKKVSEAIKGDKEQRLLTEVYGLSGYGAMNEYFIDGKSVMQLLNEGVAPSELMEQLKLNDYDKGLVDSLYKRQVDQVVQPEQIANSGNNSKVAAGVALRALTENNNAGYKLHQKMKVKHKELHDKLVELSISAYTMNTMVNKGLGSMSIGDSSKFMYTDYDGHGLVDLSSNSHEFKIVNERERAEAKYNSKLTPWVELKAPGKGQLGIMFRKSQEVYEQGLGVNMDRVQNGLHVDSGIVKDGIEQDKNWLINNNVQEYTSPDGRKRYRVILNKKQAADAEGMNNIVQSLYRSIVHNTQLVEQQTMRKMIKDRFTEDGSTDAKLRLLELRLKYNSNKKRKDKKEVKPYLKTDKSMAQLGEKYPLIAAEYMVATGVSRYDGLNNDLNYVRKGMSDMMVGFKSGSIISDSMPFLQDIERKYKQLVVLKKLKMVVASPVKLMEDIISNSAILTALDVDPIDGGKDMKEAFDYWDETSTMEAELVKVRLQVLNAEANKDEAKIAGTKARLAAIEKKMQNHPFYDAYKYGFVQSMATSMMIKEFDTVSGLQHTIDEVVKKFTLDDKRNPNEIHKAIVAFMHWGYSVEDVLKFAGNASKMNGTRFGEELVEMGKRLEKHKKAGEEDVPGYISEIIAGPQSEVVRQGSRVMQMGDLAARWALYKHTIKELLSEELGREVSAKEVADVVRGNRLGLDHKKITGIKERAAMRSLDTFVDYRLNMPSEIKKASDLAVLWFPSYWMRNAVVIPQMIAAKPVNSMAALAVSGLTGMPTVYESHPLWKLVSDKKSIVHPGMDVSTVDTFIPWWPF